jgi:hypothetical protein
MAITRSLIFQNVVLANANGASQTTYELPETESVEITVTPVNDTVGAGRTLVASFDISGTVRLANTNVYNDARVYGSNTAAEPVEARIIFRGVAGSININAGPTFLNGVSKYDGNRKFTELTFTERVTNVEAFMIETNV